MVKCQANLIPAHGAVIFVAVGVLLTCALMLRTITKYYRFKETKMIVLYIGILAMSLFVYGLWSVLWFYQQKLACEDDPSIELYNFLVVMDGLLIWMFISGIGFVLWKFAFNQYSIMVYLSKLQGQNSMCYTCLKPSLLNRIVVTWVVLAPLFAVISYICVHIQNERFNRETSDLVEKFLFIVCIVPFPFSALLGGYSNYRYSDLTKGTFYVT